MKEVTLNINGREVKAKKGSTILEAARGAGIYIPTLCHHEKLLPYGACRICTVEISKGKEPRLVASCVYNVEDGLKVKTETPRLVKIRKMIAELLLAPAPVMTDLAHEYSIKEPRFEAEDTRCTLCGLCVRYCAEVKKANAITFVGRGVNRRVAFVDDVVSTGVCMGCRECFSLCPTGKLANQCDGACFDGMTVRDYITSRS